MIDREYMATTWRGRQCCHFTCPNNEGNEEEKKEKVLVLADLKWCSNLYLTKIWIVIFHSKMTFLQKNVKQIQVNSTSTLMSKVWNKKKYGSCRGKFSVFITILLLLIITITFFINIIWPVIILIIRIWLWWWWYLE